MRRMVLALVMALLAAACGTDSAGSVSTEPPTTTTTTLPPTTTIAATTTTVAAFPVTVGGTTIEQRPERIASLSATHTEVLYALGAGDRVVATDTFSNFPAEALDTEKIDAFNVNVEAVAGVDPDLVILSFDPGDVVAGLGALGIPTLIWDAPVDLDGAFRQWTDLGDAVGERAAADGLVAETTERIDKIREGLPQTLRAPTYFHELDPLLFTVTSATFFGSLYGLLGMENIADPADDAGFGYPQLSPEFLVAADPDYIFLADTVCCGETADTFGARPGFEALTAVASDRVVLLDDDVASRWGPRLVDFVEAVVAAVYPEG